MVAAAEDLGIDLDIYDFEGNPVLLVNLVQDTLAMENRRPDAFLFHNEKRRGRQILELSHHYKVPAFLFNSGFDHSKGIGKPREFFPYWIGSMLPDDKNAGYLLAQQLDKLARSLVKTNSDGSIQIVALEGNHTSEASNLRSLGLKKYPQEAPHLKLRQFFHSKWRSELAYEAFWVTNVRYPETRVYWTASDNMALGVSKAAIEKGWIGGRDFIVGGIDLLPQNQRFFDDGSISVSVGGHYAEGAWSLTAVYDYLNGYDFAVSEGVQFKTKMFAYSSLSRQNFGDLNKRLSKEALAKIDFRRFSKTYQPELKRYRFSIESIINSRKGE